jgi:hypothetical protein
MRSRVEWTDVLLDSLDKRVSIVPLHDRENQPISSPSLCRLHIYVPISPRWQNERWARGRCILPGGHVYLRLVCMVLLDNVQY